MVKVYDVSMISIPQGWQEDNPDNIGLGSFGWRDEYNVEMTFYIGDVGFTIWSEFHEDQVCQYNNGVITFTTPTTVYIDCGLEMDDDELDQYIVDEIDEIRLTDKIDGIRLGDPDCCIVMLGDDTSMGYE